MSEKLRTPIFKLKYDEKFKSDFLEGAAEILDTGFLTNHEFVSRFEKKYSSVFGIPHFLAVSNGTSALEVALRSAGVRGKKVFLPVNTFIATYVAVVNCGALPVLFDIENVSFGIDIEKVIDHLNPQIGAVIAVHTGGLLSRSLIDLKEACQKNGVPLIEDAAHAIGSTLDGQQAGTIGEYGAFSFFTTKVMSTGEGGGLVFKSDEARKIGHSIRQFGMSEKSSLMHVLEGSNYKMTEISALLGMLELDRVKERIKKRRAIATRYQENLKGTTWNAVSESEGCQCSYYKQIVLSDVPQEHVTRYMLEQGVQLTGKVYEIPLHQQKIVQESLGDVGRFPVSDNFSKHHICPPCYPEMELEEVDYICDKLISVSR